MFALKFVIGFFYAFGSASYHDYLLQSQAAEALTLADGLKTALADNLEEGVCVSHSQGGYYDVNELKGKYITLKITGTYAPKDHNPETETGCYFEGVFSTGKAGKNMDPELIKEGANTFRIKVLNNYSLVDDGSTIPQKYMPEVLKKK